MKKNKVALLFSAIVLATSLVGCATESKKEEPMDIIDGFEKIVYDQEGTRYDAREYIDKNISSLNNLEMSSSMVNTFIYSIYENMDIYTNIVFSLQDDLAEIEKSLEVKSLENSNLSEIPKSYKLVKALLQELDENFLVLIKSNESYVVDVDMEKIKETYFEYIDNDTLDYLDFRINERKLNVYDVNSDEYNIELLLETVNTICAKLENLEGDSQNQNWIQHLYYYLEMMLSKSQTTFLDDDNKMLKDKFDELKKESKKYTNTNFGKLLNSYISLLEKNNYDVNSDEVNTFVEEVYSKLDAFLVDNN